MGKFNWWRRHKSKAKLQRKDALKGKSFLLQQIEHGDFDYSDYADQAKQELISCKKDQAALIKGWNAGPESLQYRLDEIQRKYVKRYNKLMEDHDNEEKRLLLNLREALHKEFGQDHWTKALSRCKSDLVCLYSEYRKLSKEKQKHEQI